MRSEWLGTSAALLVLGSIALTLAFAVTPLPQEATIADAAAHVHETAGQWMASAGAMFLASVGMTLGLPALLWLMTGRDRWLGVVAVSVFAIGTIGMAGYAWVLVTLRVLLVRDLLVLDELDRLVSEPATRVFVGVWLGCFLGGLLLVAAGLWRAGTVPRWVPVVLVAYVASSVLPLPGGSLGTVIQFGALTAGLTGASTAANDAAHELSQRAADDRPPNPPLRL